MRIFQINDSTNQQTMNWYIAKMIFAIKAGNKNVPNEFDEQLRMISAQNEKEAFFKARMIGMREDESFINANHELVKWEFVDIAELLPFESLSDGMQLTSHTHETASPKPYIAFIKYQAFNIEKRTQQISFTS